MTTNPFADADTRRSPFADPPAPEPDDGETNSFPSEWSHATFLPTQALVARPVTYLRRYVVVSYKDRDGHYRQGMILREDDGFLLVWDAYSEGHLIVAASNVWTDTSGTETVAVTCEECGNEAWWNRGDEEWQHYDPDDCEFRALCESNEHTEDCICRDPTCTEKFCDCEGHSDAVADPGRITCDYCDESVTTWVNLAGQVIWMHRSTLRTACGREARDGADDVPMAAVSGDLLVPVTSVSNVTP